MTIRLNAGDLTQTRSDLGLAIGTDVLAPNGSAANLTAIPADQITGTLPAVNGGSITDLNANNLGSGTVPDARFPATLPATSGVNLTALPATLPAASGVNLTALNATNLGSGSVPDARLPANLQSFPAPGSDGNVLTASSGAWTSAAAAGGGFKSMQVFRVTDATPPYAGNTATWTKPAGIKTVKVYVTGGGGGAGSIKNTSFAGYGGAAGGTSVKVIDVTSISSETVTLGKGGDAANSTTNDTDVGLTGGTSSFGSHCSATGGQGGGASTDTFGNVIAYPGEGVGGDLNLRGGPPLGQSNNSSGVYYRGSPGGSSFWGNSGQTQGSYPTGYDEIPDSGLDGAGGGGGQYGSSNAHNGGSGGGGIVVVEEYA